MADFSMFGAAQSPIAFDQKLQMNEVVMQREQAQTADFQAQARERDALAKVAQQKQQDQQRYQQVIQSIAMDKTVNTLGDWVPAIAKAGFPVEAAKLAETLSKATEARDKADEAAERATTEKLKQQGLQYENMSRLVRGINSDPNPEGAFETLKSKMREKGPLPPMIENARWTPQLADQLERASLSGKDAIAAQQKQVEDARKAKKDAAETRLKEVQAQLEAKKLTTEILRQDNLRKTGALDDVKLGDAKDKKAKETAWQAKDNVNQIGNLVLDMFPDVATDSKGRITDPGIAATNSYVAGEVEKLLQKDKALTRSEAVNQAFQDAVKGKLYENVGKKEPTEILGMKVPGTGAPGKTKGTIPSKEGKPTPSASDIAYAKAHPEVAAKFKEHFGVEP